MSEGDELGDGSAQSGKKKAKNLHLMPEDFKPYDYTQRAFTDLPAPGAKRAYYDPNKPESVSKKKKVHIRHTPVHRLPLSYMW